MVMRDWGSGFGAVAFGAGEEGAGFCAEIEHASTNDAAREEDNTRIREKFIIGLNTILYGGRAEVKPCHQGIGCLERENCCSRGFRRTAASLAWCGNFRGSLIDGLVRLL